MRPEAYGERLQGRTGWAWLRSRAGRPTRRSWIRTGSSGCTWARSMATASLSGASTKPLTEAGIDLDRGVEFWIDFVQVYALFEDGQDLAPTANPMRVTDDGRSVAEAINELSTARGRRGRVRALRRAILLWVYELPDNFRPGPTC